jgi:hypothetical protein
VPCGIGCHDLRVVQKCEKAKIPNVLFQRIWHKRRLGLSNGLLTGQGQRGLP